MALPLTIVCGYLGSGKTTLVNTALAAGRERFAVIGADPSGVDAMLIDRSRIANHGAAANGGSCPCCAPDRDLWSAVNSVLALDPPPDRLVIESSGFADPAAMMRIALSDPAIADGGIVTVADAVNLEALLSNPGVAATLERQFEAASRIVLAKSALAGPGEAASAQAFLEGRFPGKVSAHTADALFDTPPANLAPAQGLALRDTGRRFAMHSVRAYGAPGVVDADAVGRFLRNGAAGAWRVKGVLRGRDGGCFTLHKAGEQVEIRPALPHEEPGAIAAIGLSDAMDFEELDRRFGALPSGVSRGD